jgi:hypothetical protein
MDPRAVYDQPECEIKPLESIANIAEDAERSATLIEAFLTRFRHGQGGEKTSQVTPVPAGHRGQIERLRNAVCEIEKLARELGTIG